MLSLVVFLPLAGALALLAVPNQDGSRNGLIRRAALAVSLASFVSTLLLWYPFNPDVDGYQFIERAAWMPAFGIDYLLGVDGISLMLLVLTGFLTPLALLCSWESIEKHLKAFCALILILETAMMGVFVSLDLFLFYVFWDAMLIPMYFLIGIWGYDQRVYAAVKFMLYTMAGSVLMLLAIIGLAMLHHQATGIYTFDITKLQALTIAPDVQLWLFLAFALAFAIKVPLFPFHTWLPDAHVQAPTAGSVILAGVLLKMGTYGLIRFAFPLFPQAAADLRPVARLPRRRRHHLRCAGGDGPAGHEEAGRLLERQPPRLRRARHLVDERRGHAGRGLPDAGRTASAPAGSSSSSACCPTGGTPA